MPTISSEDTGDLRKRHLGRSVVDPYRRASPLYKYEYNTSRICQPSLASVTSGGIRRRPPRRVRHGRAPRRRRAAAASFPRWRGATRPVLGALQSEAGAAARLSTRVQRRPVARRSMACIRALAYPAMRRSHQASRPLASAKASGSRDALAYYIDHPPPASWRARLGRAPLAASRGSRAAASLRAGARPRPPPPARLTRRPPSARSRLCSLSRGPPPVGMGNILVTISVVAQ
jgi:hypothetical protein